ncbi:hypothetical protein SDC9_147496 [bioreactor metagenome]|uniref:Uncharacterized protein n=1 Tax=bioreactor metagenome TaxID=1076179 RepID=A0A645EG79_9ZZZZ
MRFLCGILELIYQVLCIVIITYNTFAELSIKLRIQYIKPVHNKLGMGLVLSKYDSLSQSHFALIL